MNDRELIQLLALGRLTIGTLLFVAPKRFMTMWMGVEEMPVAARWASRGLGARDAAIGVGTLVALENDGSVKGWLEAGVVADSADAFSTLAGFSEMPRLRRWLWLGTAAGAAVLGLRLASNADH